MTSQLAPIPRLLFKARVGRWITLLSITQPTGYHHLMNFPLRSDILISTDSKHSDLVFEMTQFARIRKWLYLYTTWTMYSTFNSPSTILLPSSMGEVGFFGLLMRDKPVYHAALALSQYHQHSTTLKNRDTAGDIALSQDKNEYYILALRELQGIIQRSHKWSGTAGLIQSVQALTFSLYLFFFEIWNEAIDSTSPRESFPG